MRPMLPLLSALMLVTACSGGGTASSGIPPVAAQVAAVNVPSGRTHSLIVYTLSNGVRHNRVLAFAAHRGRLRYSASFDTGGLGDPSVAGTVQGSIAMSGDDRFLFAVDPGSNEITSFRVTGDLLQFVARVASRGMQPVSLTVHRDLLFVLNEASSTIAGFRIDRNGNLHPIRNSIAMLSGTGVGPAEIAFDGSGRVLVVTEKATNNIDTYSVAHGIPDGPAVHSSLGTTPFGFAFVPEKETMVVSEAFGGASGAGAASSYQVTPPATLTPVSASVPDENTAPCWVVITRNGRFAFTSNTGSATISAYAIDPSGNLTLTTPDGISAHTKMAPTDLALGGRDRFLFALDLKSRSIGAYAVSGDGALSALNAVRGLPSSALGLAATAGE